MRQLKYLPWLLVLLLVIVAGCEAGDPESDQDRGNRERAVEMREERFTEAETKYPVPRTVNFPLRKALVEFAERQDLMNHPWYIYIQSMTGEYVAYYVGETYPINTCNFLSSSEKIRDDDSGGNLVLTAPSIDGMYYGGGGSSAACDVYFFKDVETDTMLIFKSPMFIGSDAPLDIDVPRVKVAGD